MNRREEGGGGEQSSLLRITDTSTEYQTSVRDRLGQEKNMVE
jgi:hypothetical protein